MPATGKGYKIIYEDDCLIIVDKPSGMLVIPTPKKENNTLTRLLNEELDRRNIQVNAYPCHRIDRETSGIVIYAKGKNAQGLMMERFKNRMVKKTYIAFVHGIVKKNADTIKSYIYNRNKNRNELAITKYNTIQKQKDFSVVEVVPITGRTNQIRIHFKEIGHPLVGESVYAFRKDFKLKFKRAALHARAIEFTHPITKKRLNFTSPLPNDMGSFLPGGKIL
jgi:23S rRNA pseudouridine1911/1915/1917 synthase